MNNYKTTGGKTVNLGNFKIIKRNFIQFENTRKKE